MRRPSALLLAFAALGCHSDEQAPGGLAHGCVVNSDCIEPLSCLLGRCHAQCAATRDCPMGQRCLITGSVGICQLPDEAPCRTGADCMGGLVCTTEGRCVSGCSDDRGCPSDERCVDAVCRPAVRDAGGADAADVLDEPQVIDASGSNDASGSSDAGSDGGSLFTTVLDRFDRADGPLNSGGVTQWLEYDHTGAKQYAIASGKLSGTLDTGVPLWWDVPFGGADTVTEAFITIGSLSSDVTDMSLLLASQTLSFCDFVRVFYEVSKGTISAVSCQDSLGMVYGTPASVGLLANVRLGAKFETKSGKLTVYLDDTLVGSWTIDEWRYLGKAGRIGIWLHREPGGTRGPDTFDDFGGR